MAIQHHARTLPADLNAPVAVVDAWRTRALIVAGVFGLISIYFLITNFDYFIRAWLHGFVLIWGFTVGGMALLMVQYLSGGKWGLVLRRPLEAMTRTLPLVALIFIPVGLFAKRLYLWAAIKDVPAALRAGTITGDEAHAILFKRPMLNIPTFWLVTAGCFLIWGFFIWRLNSMSLARDADPELNARRWQIRFENVSGCGVVIYAITMSLVALYCVMSLDVTWYSSIWGLLFLVNQGFAVFAISIHTVLSLSRYEPYGTMLRVTEQHDLGKLTFAFVMLNIYLAFSQYLIIWSGNLPDEIPWYLNRVRGGWGIIATLDFIFHWVIPFTLLLSRDIKRNKPRMMALCKWIIFARAWDMFWLIEPNFRETRQHLNFGPGFGVLAYMVVPVFIGSIWFAYFFTQLKSRPVFPRNDPHVAEVLEPEHVLA